MTEVTSTVLHTGDTKDDDGAVLDSFFEANPNPSLAPIEAIDVTPDVDIRIPNRLISGRLVVGKDWTSYTQLLPADVNRCGGINFAVMTTNDTDYIEIVGDPATGQITGKAGRLYETGPVEMFVGYTGPLYVKAVGSADVELSYWTVSK